MSNLRIAILGISHEAMIAAPGTLDPSNIDVTRGERLLNSEIWTARGIIRRLREEPDVEIVPILAAKCLPGAVFPRSYYEEIKAEIITALKRCGPLDGICISNHGAMEIEGLSVSGDTDFFTAIRASVGEDMPITAAMDMHGQLTPEILAAVNAWAVFRTAPHRDDDRTGYSAANQLLRIIRERLKTRTAAVRIPLFLPGEFAMTAYSPTKELYEALYEIDKREGVLESNLFVGFAWNDRPWIGMTALVTAESDIEAAKTYALEIAANVWRERGHFGLKMEALNVREGLLAAQSYPETGIYLSDSGDNVAAGAHGDLTFVLQEALDLPQIRDLVVTNIVAPAQVSRCAAAGIGNKVTLELGTEHISRPSKLRTVEAIVQGFGEDLQPAGGQAFSGSLGAWAKVRIGGIIATFHARRVTIISPQHLEAMDIHPTAHKMYVFKLGYLMPELEDIANRHVLLLSDGAANLDLTRLDYRQIRRPAYPFDPAMTWEPQSGLYTDGRS